ncbi:hypothetical protein BS47DRAFT_1364070 [Hydnum rufescens UP504]|uniref:Uncharacterized protein n=1 Tax=Hydnum rufescens UP504 TaxID=1448309 RepID=A0A9P6ASK3_9AGAM|nr:hypothetical protein BS47DRAFT_1364070 [Hydnum rufescens UP504]
MAMATGEVPEARATFPEEAHTWEIASIPGKLAYCRINLSQSIHNAGIGAYFWGLLDSPRIGNGQWGKKRKKKVLLGKGIIFCFWNEKNPLKFGRDGRGIGFGAKGEEVVERMFNIVPIAAPKPLPIWTYVEMKQMYP